MTATPPGKPHSPAPSGKGSGAEKRSGAEQTRVFYSRFLGWLVLAIILGYAGLQMPLPWRLLSVPADCEHAADLLGRQRRVRRVYARSSDPAGGGPLLQRL